MARKRILVVDDEPAVSHVIVQFLAKDGLYEVREANHGTDALEIVREWPPDLLVLDIVMPGMDGGELLAAIRAQEGLENAPAIFLTGLVTEAEIGPDGYEIGGQPVLAKPVRADAFRAAVASRLEEG